MPRKETLDLLRRKVQTLRNQIITMEQTVRVKSKDSTSSCQSRHNYRPCSFANIASPKMNSTQPVSLALKVTREKLLEETKKAPRRQKEYNQKQQRLSPDLHGLVGEMDSNYYHHTLQSSRQSSESTQRKASLTLRPHRFQFSEFGQTRDSPSKEGKRKAFEEKKTDLILNPESATNKGIKIVRKIERSPDRMYTENPNSNPKVYFQKQKMILLQGRASNGQKNASHLVTSPRNGAITTQKTFKKNAGQGGKRHFEERKPAVVPERHRRHYVQRIKQNLNSSIGW